jgi:hypothetical protein
MTASLPSPSAVSTLRPVAHATLEPLRICGWGGEVELRGLDIDVDYRPGLYEVTQVVASALGTLTAIAAIGLGWALFALGSPVLAWTALGGASISLLAATALWLKALASVRMQGKRHIELDRGWVREGMIVRQLADATLDLETTRLLFFGTFTRASLVFDDGTVIPLAQGPREEVKHLAHALVHAPCLTR